MSTDPHHLSPEETGIDTYEDLLEELPDELEELSEADLEQLKEEYDEEPN